MQTSNNQNNQPNLEQIAAIAQTLWQQAGQPDGRDLEFWLKAEQKIKTGPGPQPSISANEVTRQKASSSELLPSAGSKQTRRDKKASANLLR